MNVFGVVCTRRIALVVISRLSSSNVAWGFAASSIATTTRLKSYVFGVTVLFCKQYRFLRKSNVTQQRQQQQQRQGV